LTSSKLRMNDQERLSAIDRIADALQEKRIFLQRFAAGTRLRALQEKDQLQNINNVRTLYALPQ
ncbi:MAG: TerB family tellurite resistance protein, partial [Mucilaginibacter polytrichastri]|nr:TerB family tellurite resistance protein [Mucilaginibacter polytrichastri]